MSARSLGISRRHFIASTSVAATAVCVVPHRVFGDEENLVVASRKAGETANITVQALRGNVSALIGSAYDAKWGTGFVNGEFFTKLVYKGVG
jgi:hypothetical protein